MSAPRVLQARWLALSADRWLEGGGIVVEQGRVARVLERTALRRWCRRAGVLARDLGAGVLAPGLVNAHAHLDLSALAGRLAPVERERSGDFPAWIRGLLAERMSSAFQARDPDADIRAGARRCLATGTTAVGDIDASGRVRSALARSGPRVRIFREVLDVGLSERRKATLSGVARGLPPHQRLSEGLSPHAPYTVSDELLAAAAGLVRKRALPVAMHWAETEDEVAAMAAGTGPLAELLPDAPRGPGRARLEAAGLLGERTLLIHANHPARGERAAVARSGAHVVHCPGSHAFFGRERFALAAWRRAGVPLALGTDSLASNVDLDMRREMRLLRQAAPGLAPGQAFELATAAGGRALGLPCGTLEPGSWADAVLFEAPGDGPEALLEALTAGLPRVAAVWVGGEQKKSVQADRIGEPNAGEIP